jgi:hypothetical protein
MTLSSRAVPTTSLGEERIEWSGVPIGRYLNQRMFRRSGRRFADKNMRRSRSLEHVPIPKERDML